MSHNLRLVLIFCLLILILLYFCVEGYTSDRSKWVEAQQNLEDTRSNAEKLGISEEEYNAIRENWKSQACVTVKDGEEGDEKAVNPHSGEPCTETDPLQKSLEDYSDDASKLAAIMKAASLGETPILTEGAPGSFGEVPAYCEDAIKRGDKLAECMTQGYYMSQADPVNPYADMNLFCVSGNSTEWNETT